MLFFFSSQLICENRCFLSAEVNFSYAKEREKKKFFHVLVVGRDEAEFESATGIHYLYYRAFF